MKYFSLRSFVLVSVGFLFPLVSPAAPTPPGGPYPVTYNPVTKLVQGNQPLTQSYALTITSPANLTVGAPVTVSLGVSVLSKPSAAVTDATALSFISLNQALLPFTGPNQQLTTTVTVSVPLGNFAGDYAFKITPSGWPTGLGVITDSGATVNVRVSAPDVIDTTPPAVTLLSPANGTVYTYTPTSGIPVTVPISFSASVGTNGQPIDTMLAFIDNTSVNLSPTGLLTLSASATGSVQLTAGGNYTVSVLATNRNGTSRASAGISVVVNAPPPAIVPSLPASNSSYSFTLGGTGASVPVSFSATSAYGNITSLSATLDGSPVALTLSGVNAATTASGSASLTVATIGSHSLVLSAANVYGAATPVTIPFTVTGLVPAPTVSILAPVTGAIFTRAAGDPATVVNYSFQGGTSYGSITAVSVKVDGVAVAATVTGLNTASIAGSGALSYTAPGQHTISVTLTNNGGATASASTTFNVTQIQPQVCRDLNWLPPISLNKTIAGGSTMPIAFTLLCNGRFVRDTSVLIATYEVFGNGSTSTPVIYHYGPGSPNPPDYTIKDKQYQLNFKTAKGAHSYRVEVYSSASGSLQLLGSKEINTKGKKHGNGHDHDDDDDDDDDDDGDCGDWD